MVSGRAAQPDLDLLGNRRIRGESLGEKLVPENPANAVVANVVGLRDLGDAESLGNVGNLPLKGWREFANVVERTKKADEFGNSSASRALRFEKAKGDSSGKT